MKYTYNRYYHRGSSPFGVGSPNCCDNYLRFNRNYGNRVLSANNQYADSSPSFAQYITFSDVMTLQDIEILLDRYNKLSKPEILFGPFNQKNLNLVSSAAYNDIFWRNEEKTNLPHLQQVAYKCAVLFTDTMNTILKDIVKTTSFTLSKNKIIDIYFSSQTRYYKYIMQIMLSRGEKTEVFEVVFYYHQDIVLGKALYVGSGTTDQLMLPGYYPTPGMTLQNPKEMLHFDKASEMFLKSLQ
jgi:hypothetical protein